MSVPGNYASVRLRFSELLDEPNEDWKFTETALADGYRLGWTELRMVDFILDLLRAGGPLKEVPLGEPPGSGGIGYTMTNIDHEGLYIKLKEDWDRVLILSFKISKHYRGS